MTESLEAPRLEALDGLRGLAAASVVLEHCLLTVPMFWAAYNERSPLRWDGPPWVGYLAFTPLRLFWAGNPAVNIFFVLSGLVLSLPFWSARGQSYIEFFVRRIFRLYPVYLISIALTAVLFAVTGPTLRPDMSSWFAGYWKQQIDDVATIRVLLFLPSKLLELNSPLWTLVHEFRISLVVPALIVGMARWPLKTLIGCIAMSLTAKVCLSAHLTANTDVISLLDTLTQVWLFALGIQLGKELANLRALLANLSKPMISALIVITVLALVSKFMFPMPDALRFLLTGVAAAVLVGMAAASPLLARLLSTSAPRFLGKISYTLYAFHFPIVFAALHAAVDLPATVIIPAAVLVSVGLAAALSAGIEPMMTNYGRNLSRRFKRQFGRLGDGTLVDRPVKPT